MNDDIHVNPWSPFDPAWYKKAFDRFMSTADMLFRQEEIIKEGYHIPDSDGSRSSVFRNSAVLNNSFDEEVLRDSLKDIYLNLSHKLVASNHDNVNFFQWHGTFSDLRVLPNVNTCELRIPLYFHDIEVDDYQINVKREDVPIAPMRMQWINAKERDKFKMSQFYRKWIKVEDILNNWRIFKWHLMLFINQRPYSEYEIFVDEQEISLRFQYHDTWVRNNATVSLFRFDTNYSKRIKINSRLCTQEWNWKMPISFINDDAILNHPKVIVVFNRIGDMDIRRDDLSRGIKVLGENLEFLELRDGYIDLNEISNRNKWYIQGEFRERIWMSIIVPKFFHEYPILLPTDVLHRPYEPSLRKVKVLRKTTPQNVRTEIEEDEDRQVYIDLRERMFQHHDGWLSLIRPIVFADAYDDPFNEPYDALLPEIRRLRDVIVDVSKIIERFKNFVRDPGVEPETEKTIRGNVIESPDVPGSYINAHIAPCEETGTVGEVLFFSEGTFRVLSTTDTSTKIKSFNLEDFVDETSQRVEIMYDYQNKFHDIRRAHRDPIFEREYRDRFLPAMEDIRYNEDSLWIYPNRPDDPTLWTIASSLINRAKELVEKYYVVEVLRQIRRRHIWTNPNDYLGEIRFQRPVDCNNFWMFEYDHDNDRWMPTHLNINRHFPDAYLPSVPNQPTPTPHKVYKAFFFYADTMNVLEESNDIRRATPSWNDDIIEYHHEVAAKYRDIFMEKFYWMGVRAIYKGLMMTVNRWEAIEYVIDNPTYQRFNELFLQTMDPYFKLGLATYLKSPNFEFPFDDAINKMKEAVSLDWNGFTKVTNFEVYLNNHWIPSYFDYIMKIMDDWEPGNRLRRRPPATFEMRRIFPILSKIQESLIENTSDVLNEIEWIITQLKLEGYGLHLSLIEQLESDINTLLSNMEYVLQLIQDLDLYTYSIEHVNEIRRGLEKHGELTQALNDIVSYVYNNVRENESYSVKRVLVNDIKSIVDLFQGLIDKIITTIEKFDMKDFMFSVNDLRSLEDAQKTNPHDRSLIGRVNRFDDTWTQQVQKTRDALFVSTVILNGMWDPDKAYSNDEVNEFVSQVNTVKQDIANFRRDIERFWTYRNLERDQVVIDKLDHAQFLIETFNTNMLSYYEIRNDLVGEMDRVRELLNQFETLNIGETEKAFIESINTEMDCMLNSLSYITGHIRRAEAEEALSNIYNIISDWLSFIIDEEEVFRRIFDIVRPPSTFLNNILYYQGIIGAIIEYMSLIDTEYFIPDAGWPTFADIYSTTDITIANHGFRHAVDDIIFIPRVGSYKVVDIEGEVARATALDDTGWRNTNFRNPMIHKTVQVGSRVRIKEGTQWMTEPATNIPNWVMRITWTVDSLDNNGRVILDKNGINSPISVEDLVLDQVRDRSYGSVSSGDGAALTVYVSEVDHIRIINDKVIIPFITRIRNVIYNINRFVTIMNPHNNFEFNVILNSVDRINNDWESRLDVLYHYITDDSKTEMRNIIDGMEALITPSRNFMDGRARININKLRQDFGNIIMETRRYANVLEITDPVFFYHDRNIRIVFESLSTFIGRGNVWNDLGRLEEIMLDINESLMVSFTDGIFPLFPMGDIFTGLINSRDEIISSIEDIKEAIVNLPTLVSPVTTLTESIQNAIDDIDTDSLRSDEWYRINNVNIAVRGEGYQLGDIVQIVPDELPPEIDYDIILLQVMRVDDGRVVQIQPMMDYAIPYEIWGIRETITMTGGGTGLTVDVFSNRITLDDYTFLRNELSAIPRTPQFDDNDLFMFKFENIHDLNIQYEVFMGGTQITNYVQRQENVNPDDPLFPRKLDVIYINANDVMALGNSSIYIPGEHYFVYKIDHIEIKDPGAGYAVDQEIFVDTGEFALRLRVAQLVHEPYKGIKEVQMSDGRLSYRGENPRATDAVVVTDTMNNIDDEFTVSYYDQLGAEGIMKPATISYPQSLFEFHSIRHDDMDGDPRNEVFMYPDVGMVDVDPSVENGDPDYHWYLGARIDNSFTEVESNLWNGIEDLVPMTNPFIPDILRIPPDQPHKGEYHMYDQVRFHNTESTINADLVVATYDDLPRHIVEWPEGRVGARIIVESDENHKGHRMLYRIRTFVAAGFFVFNWPEIADNSWNTLSVDWMDADWYPDLPNLRQQYPDAPWHTHGVSFRRIQEAIVDGRFKPHNIPQEKNNTSYIHQAGINDIAVFNWTLKKWEDLSDTSRWEFTLYDEPDLQNWGFDLTFLEDGYYSYDFKFYWNKTPDTQTRNELLKRNAVIDIYTSIIDEVYSSAISHAVNTGRVLRIRKLFPFEQKESFVIGYSEYGDPLGFEMNFKIANYMHFKNQLHLQDVKIFNKTTNEFEDLSNRCKFEVRFKDPRVFDRGKETTTRISRWFLIYTGVDVNGEHLFGSGFVDGEVWGYNPAEGVHIFGRVTTNIEDGSIITFEPTHCPNPPIDESTILQFQLFQSASQTDLHHGLVQIEFKTSKLPAYGEGYIKDGVDFDNDFYHSIYNPLSPLPEEFQIIVASDMRRNEIRNIGGPIEYEVSIIKTPHQELFIRPEWEFMPTFTIEGKNIPGSRMYLMTDRGRFPLRNPSTGTPSFSTTETAIGTDVKFLNLYRRYEHIEVRSVPFPMRSVYVQRRIPSHGFIDIQGKINKPLNKKYFEFWVNGRLLDEEVTIITPTKFFLHGLRSLRNLEIVEINRDPNEFFSDPFLDVRIFQSRPDNFWNFRTYLDGALEGNLEGDNYSLEEQEYLLSPVWRQVSPDHPAFKDYPPNVDSEEDIMLRVRGSDTVPFESLNNALFQFLIVDPPTIEGVPVTGRNMRWSQFGLREISNEQIIDLLNEEWEEEIRNNPRLPTHVIISDDDWYGTTARLYDEFGIRVHTLNEALYQIYDWNKIHLNSRRRTGRIVQQDIHYNLD